MLSDLKDKRALVTGAAQGLGRAVAELFVARGARVLLTDIDGDLVAKTAADLGDAAHPLVSDVTSEADVAASVRACVDTLGGLDIAVNNAGIEIGKPLVEQTEEEFDRLMDINVKGVFFGIKHQTPALVASGGGAIVNMSSVAGLGGVPLLGSYCASKAAVLRLTETAAIELRAAGIRVNAVCPSFIQTEMVARLVNPFEGATGANFDDLVAVKQQRLGTPEEVAEMVAFLASDDARFVTGAHYTLDSGLTGSLL
ncbi:SDR family oxidoreductase [Pseudonocardia eucalypti]|uniref:SDR family oxidoreductase n=1 Tax=Pseudonocardia eucalypti TaxID=648755 RepID=A0ABP9RF15_9PSEU|nr:NAD(P)-dependent dehydrogenase (short-subunit alcohol dehydrogenase family) [Pseudonocardia eucalypti]